MKNRIRLILDYKRISNKDFANVIGVQPSTVSQILSGRQNPSYDSILKLVRAYPDINLRWLLLGDGRMLDKEELIPTNLFSNKEHIIKNNDDESYIHKSELNVTSINTNKNTSELNKKTKEIEKIVTFYNDKTFDEYYPQS